ncbi:MAG: FeoB-associated Cys-rich membrane protein [Prevotella sp.]|nr:FeoB-associated Cys-rich membrane protein [Prevotella sp.]
MGANIFLIAIVLIVGGWALYFHIEDKKEEKRKLSERKKNLNR